LGQGLILFQYVVWFYPKSTSFNIVAPN
jgi:hypothetical protein